MRILIPGGSGQVGTLLARHLLSAGHVVTVISRTPRPAPPGPDAADLVARSRA